MISVLDNGYVRVRDHMGDDLKTVNAARVSYDKASYYDLGPHEDPPEQVLTPRMAPRDEKLLNFLLSNDHTSPLRHSAITYEVYAPLMVMRQWGKYRVGSVWGWEDLTDSDDPLETVNESSRRYITEEPVFYIPDVWRSAPENSKQGSGDPVNKSKARFTGNAYQRVINEALFEYERALNRGVCAEQARLFLPAYALYVRSWWTVSLQGVIHFIRQRVEHDAQWEIQQYAQAVRDLTAPLFPKTFELLGLESDEGV